MQEEYFEVAFIDTFSIYLLYCTLKKNDRQTACHLSTGATCFHCPQ